jgi:hypothetical protein
MKLTAGFRMLLAGALLTGAQFLPAQQVTTESGKRITVLPAGTAVSVQTLDNIDVSQPREGCKYRVITVGGTELDGTIVIPGGSYGEICIVKESAEAGPGRKSLYGIKLTDLLVNGKKISLDSSTARLTVDPTGSTYPGPRSGVTIYANTVLTFTLKAPAEL